MDLDLQNLEPEPKEVTLRGVTFLVFPANVRGLIAIEKLFNNMKKMEGSEFLKDSFAILEPLIPSFKKKEIDFNTNQLMSLLKYVYDAGLEESTETKETKKEVKKK